MTTKSPLLMMSSLSDNTTSFKKLTNLCFFEKKPILGTTKYICTIIIRENINEEEEGRSDKDLLPIFKKDQH